jgi:S-adenosylmethionine-diacylgycerolhomoserine-N-methlytransferase
MSAVHGLDPLPGDNHAQRMDRMYRYQRHVYDLTRKYYLLGRDHAIRELHVPLDGTLLEIGCGTGRNLLLAHHHYPTARLHGLDISAQMLASAEANFRGKSVKPVLKVADATRFSPIDFDLEGFDRVLISYALSMIPDWQAALDTALLALRPGGSLHIVDFGQQENLPTWFRTGLRSWLTRFHVTPRADLVTALEQRLESHNAEMTFTSIGCGYAWHAVVQRPNRRADRMLSP